MSDGTLVGTESVSISSDNSWHNWSFVYEHTTTSNIGVMKSYKNGALLNQDTITGFDNFLTVVSTDELSWEMGKPSSSLRDFRVYLRPLNNDQLKSLTEYQSFNVGKNMKLSEGYNNPFSLYFNDSGKETHIDIPHNFIELTKQNFQNEFNFWLKPVDNGMEINFQVDDVITLNMTKTNIMFSMTDGRVIDVIAEGMNLILNRWYNVVVKATHYTSYIELSIVVKDQNNISVSKNPVSRYYVPFVIDSKNQCRFSKIVGCLLDSFKITGALDNLLLNYGFDNVDNGVILNSLGTYGYNGNDLYSGSIVSGVPRLSNDFINNVSSLDTVGNETSINVGENMALRFNTVELTVSFWKNDLDTFREGNDFYCYGSSGDIVKIVAPNKNRGVDFIVGNSQTTMKTCTDTNKILPNRWYYYVFVLSFDGLKTKMDIYVDAILSASYESSDFIPFEGVSPINAILGDGISPSYIENFKIYNRVLSADDVYRVFYLDSILTSVDSSVLFRFEDLSNIKNYGTIGDAISPVVYDNTGIIIRNREASYYSGNEYNVYRKNNWSVYWAAPRGNEFIGFNGNRLMEDFNSSGRISIMFRQRIESVGTNVDYNTFSISDGNNVYVDVKTPNSSRKASFVVGGYSCDVNVNTNEISGMWVSWVFTCRINGKYLYMKIYKDGYVVARKTHDTGSQISFNGITGAGCKIGGFLDSVYLEDFRIYNRLLTYADIPQSLAPKKLKNDIEVVDITREELEYDLGEVFSGTNVVYSVESDPLVNARIDGNIAKIFGNYRGQTYDVVWKGSNNNGHVFWKTKITEVNAPPITFVPPDAGASITLTNSFSLVGAEGTEQYNEFVVQVEQEIADALGVDVEYVEVLEITAGSIIIDFVVKSNPKKPDIVPAVLLKDLNEQKDDGNSKFKNSKLIGSGTVDVPEEVLKQADNPDTIYFTVETDQPEEFNIGKYFQGLSVDFKIQSSPYDNVVVDAKKKKVFITGNFRDTTYVVEVKASNPSSVKTLKFEITELPLEPPKAKENGRVTIGEEDEIIDITDKFIGSRLTVYEIFDSPYENVVALSEGELDTDDEEGVSVVGKYRISGSYRNKSYQIRFKATQDVSNPQSAVWVLDVLELPSPPVKEIPDMSVSLSSGQLIEYNLGDVISGSNVEYSFVKNRYESVIENNVLRLVENSRGIKYDIEIQGANNGGYRNWVLSVTETEPPVPVRLENNVLIKLGKGRYERDISKLLTGVNIEYNVAQFDKGSGYLNTVEHDVFTLNVPWARYHAQNWSYDVLKDTSGNDRESITTTNGIVREIVSYGNGATVPINYLIGTKTDSLKVPMPNSSTWTVCVLLRYNGQNRGKILSGENIILGHWGGNRGIVQIGNSFITNAVNVGTVDDWLVLCVKTNGAVTGNVLIDGVNSGVDVGSVAVPYLYVNKNLESDWALADMMIWDSELSDDKMKQISEIFMDSLKGDAMIVREDMRSLDKLDVYKNVSLLSGLLSVAGNYRANVYDVYLTAENIKGVESWTATVRELMPPLPDTVGDMNIEVTVGEFRFPLVGFVSGYNVEYNIDVNSSNGLVNIDGDDLVINANRRNISYSVIISGTNASGKSLMTLGVVETGLTLPRRLSGDSYYYVDVRGRRCLVVYLMMFLM